MDEDEVVKEGIALYDGSVPYRVKIFKSSIRYGRGDDEDPPEFRDDLLGEWYDVWYGYPGQPESKGPKRHGGGIFATLGEAIDRVTKATGGTVRWMEEKYKGTVPYRNRRIYRKLPT